MYYNKIIKNFTFMRVKNSPGYFCPYFCSYCWQMQTIALF